MQARTTEPGIQIDIKSPVHQSKYQTLPSHLRNKHMILRMCSLSIPFTRTCKKKFKIMQCFAEFFISNLHKYRIHGKLGTSCMQRTSLLHLVHGREKQKPPVLSIDILSLRCLQNLCIQKLDLFSCFGVCWIFYYW